MDEIKQRKSQPLLKISIVMELTGLTARQIRYYEDQKLINVYRTKGKQRLYSLNQVDILLIIKQHLSDGFNIEDIRRTLIVKNARKKLLTINKLDVYYLMK
ncbi:MerR family transcriptional regulator [Holzapfeliella floricola]|uniref:MerR family transcriptional regulator n=1 Tax=Holzapfeliella floricola TaxID=679249 RepID=UPI00078218A3|nr:MerR family transcriptional regulator [Holzapfeliella floricola]